MLDGLTFARARSHQAFGSAIVATSALSAPATAQVSATTDSDVTSGLVAYDAGRYGEAADHLSRAMDRLGVPMLSLYAARCSVKLGKWVKASELYALAARVRPKAVASIPQLQAQYEAEREREDLLERMPRLTIFLEGEDLEAVDLTLDSVPVPKGLIGTHQLVDPGHHVIRAARDGQVVTGELDLSERQHKTTRLHFARRESAASPSQELPIISTTASTNGAATAIPVPTGATSASRSSGRTTAIGADEARAPSARIAQDTSPATDHTLRTLGWVGVGLGGTGVLVGTLTGISAMSARSGIRAQCAADRCPQELASDVDHYNRLRDWSTASFLAGAMAAAAGLTLILVDSSKTGTPATSVRVGATSASWVGFF